MEAHRKTFVELFSTILFLAALFFPTAGLVSVEEINAVVTVLLAVAMLGGPLFVALVPNAADWKLGRGPNLALYRKAIVSAITSGMSLVALYWPDVGLVSGAHVDAFVGVILTMIVLFAPPLVWRVPNGPTAKVA